MEVAPFREFARTRIAAPASTDFSMANGPFAALDLPIPIMAHVTDPTSTPACSRPPSKSNGLVPSLLRVCPLSTTLHFINLYCYTSNLDHTPVSGGVGSIVFFVWSLQQHVIIFTTLAYFFASLLAGCPRAGRLCTFADPDRSSHRRLCRFWFRHQRHVEKYTDKSFAGEYRHWTGIRIKMSGRSFDLE